MVSVRPCVRRTSRWTSSHSSSCSGAAARWHACGAADETGPRQWQGGGGSVESAGGLQADQDRKCATSVSPRPSPVVSLTI